MAKITMNERLALRIEQSEIDHTASWMHFLRSVDGNPFAITVSEIGGAVAFMDASASLGPLMNRILGFDEDSIPQLPSLMRLYHDRQVGCRIDINPYRGTPRVYNALADAGLVPVRFHNAMYLQLDRRNLPAAARPVPPNVTVERIAPGREKAWTSVWLDAFTGVMGISREVGAALAASTAFLHASSGWTLYMALVDERPAAAAALYVQDGMATLCLAGTRSEFRGRGCQTALLTARIADANEQECDLVVAQSALGTTSQNNMERAGLRVAYTRAFWWKAF